MIREGWQVRKHQAKTPLYVGPRQGKEACRGSACYVTNDVIHDRHRAHTALPFILFDGGRVEGRGDFGADRLNRVLTGGASLAGMYEPTNFYPFSRDGNEELAAKHVMTGLSAWLSKSRPKSPDRLVDDEVALAIPKIVHPQYKHMGERRQNMPCSKVKKILASLVSRRVQGNQGQEGRRQACRTSAPKIQRGCQTIVKNRMVQITLD